MTDRTNNPNPTLRAIPVCQHCGARTARLIVTYRNDSEAALCVDHFSALMRYEETPIAAIRGIGEE